MDYYGPEFVVTIVGFTMMAWIITTFIRAKYGYPITDDWGTTVSKEDGLPNQRKTELLAAENERLHGQVSRLEERIAVLERIATDPAARTAREIDALAKGD